MTQTNSFSDKIVLFDAPRINRTNRMTDAIFNNNL